MIAFAENIYPSQRSAYEHGRRDYARAVRSRHGCKPDDRVGVSMCPTGIRNVKNNNGQMLVSAIANTAAVDLADEVLLPEGADPVYFKRFKSILFNHRDDVVVGKMVTANLIDDGVQGKKWRVQMQISQATEFTRDLTALIQDGCINGTSVGFRRRVWSAPSEDERAAYGDHRTIVREWDWLELSIVSMPCNPEAIIEEVKSARIARSTALDLGVPKEAFAFDAKPGPRIVKRGPRLRKKSGY